MRVRVYKETYIDTEVSIDAEQITQALRDSLDALTRTEGAGERADRAILEFITASWQCLAAMTDGMIAGIKPEHREIIGEKLNEQAARYWICGQRKPNRNQKRTP